MAFYWVVSLIIAKLLKTKDARDWRVLHQGIVFSGLLLCCQIIWTAVLADIASKVTRVRTLANMLAAAPLASSMFSDWGRQAGEDLSHKPCYHCNFLFCPPMHQNPEADLGILVGGGVDIICNTYNLSATPFLQVSLSVGCPWGGGGLTPLTPPWIRQWKPTWDDLLCPNSTSTIECSSMSTRIWRMDWDLHPPERPGLTLS